MRKKKRQAEVTGAEESEKIVKKVGKAKTGSKKQRRKQVFWLGDAPADEPSEAVKAARQRLGIKLRGAPAPAPAEVFTDPGFPPAFRDFFEGAKGRELPAPTPIQMQAWPAALLGLDIVGIAPTGSGKTLAFLLPAVPRLLAREAAGAAPAARPRALVLVPTRELAQQVCGPFKGLGGLTKLFGLRAAAVVGGVDRAEQLAALREGGLPHVVVATPGRLLDLVRDSSISLANVDFLVMDEADRMLALGFEPQLDELAQVVPSQRQTLLFSATFPLKVRQAAERWLAPTNVIIRVAALEVDRGAGQAGAAEEADEAPSEAAPTGGKQELGGTLTVSALVRQTVHVCAAHKKPQKLTKWLTKVRHDEEQQGIRQKAPVLIFCNKIKTVLFVADTLAEACPGERCASLHSRLSQAQREQALLEFKAGRCSALVSTDVAARGLHAKRLKYVVNYDFPSNLEQYCHRIGRTGRSGEEGFAYSFLTRNLSPLAKDLVSLLERTGASVDPNLRDLAAGGSGGRGDPEEAPRKRPRRGKAGDKPEATAASAPPRKARGRSGKAADDASEASSDVGCSAGGGGLRIKPRKRSAAASSDSDNSDNSDSEAGSGPNKSRDEGQSHVFKRPRGKRGGKKNKKWW